MPDSQSLARYSPVQYMTTIQVGAVADNSATRWSRCSAQRVDHNLCYQHTRCPARLRFKESHGTGVVNVPAQSIGALAHYFCSAG